MPRFPGGATSSSMPDTAYLAPKDLTPELLHELRAAGAQILWQRERLVLTSSGPVSAAWAQNIWFDAQLTPIASIKDAASKLRAIQRNWALYSICEHRRAALIQEQMPPVSARPLAFGEPAPQSPLGAWTLLDRETMLHAARCSSPFAHGEARFVEDTHGPPSRAYLKLWELFTLLDARPRPGEFCLDLGGSPGGWAWVLAQLGADVLSIDKAPLDPKVAALPTVQWRQGSAFALDAAELARLGQVDWLFSDVVCYPERLLPHVQRWRDTGRVKNFVCTLKFQGQTDHETAEAFKNIPGSRLMHLAANKHELTWVLLTS